MRLSLALLLIVGQGAAFLTRPPSSPISRHVLRMSSIDALSVSELKRLLTDRGVDIRDCLEKRDLIDRLKNSPAAVSPVTKTDSLTNDETRLIETFKRVSPSVAYIQTSVQQARGFSFQPTEVPAGTGSGFLWDSRGHVVTNYHVIAASGNQGGTVKVKLQGMAQARDAVVVGMEPEKDIAVLRLNDTSNLPKPIDVGTSNDLQVGQSVLAIGNPFGLDDTLTKGIVSACGRDVPGVGGRPIRGCIQTDAAINPGNSGGPLLDSRGNLIGVNTAIYSRSGGSNGIGFAIPVDTVRRVVNQIIRYGKVVRPTLGINAASDQIKRSVENNLGRTLDGVIVAEVFDGSPAAASGLQASQMRSDGSIVLGDIITHVNGQTTRQVEDLMSAIEEREDGDTVDVRVWRQGDPRRAENIKIRLTTRDKLQRNGYRNANIRQQPSRRVSMSGGAWE
jgi:S1-C subfamily serine protease